MEYVRYVGGFIDALGLENITLVIHHCGSALGLHAMRNESNVKGIALMEAFLMPIPSFDSMLADKGEMFQAFRTPEVGWDMIVS